MVRPPADSMGLIDSKPGSIDRIELIDQFDRLTTCMVMWLLLVRCKAVAYSVDDDGGPSASVAEESTGWTHDCKLNGKKTRYCSHLVVFFRLYPMQRKPAPMLSSFPRPIDRGRDVSTHDMHTPLDPCFLPARCSVSYHASLAARLRQVARLCLTGPVCRLWFLVQ